MLRRGWRLGGLLVAVFMLATPVAASATTRVSWQRTLHPAGALYKLHGTLSDYTAASGSSDGSITILVGRAKFAHHVFVNESLTFTVTSSTKVVVPRGGTISNGDQGTLWLRVAPGTKPSGLDSADVLDVFDLGKPKPPASLLFILHGTLSNYVPAKGSTDGSITIAVKSVNFEPHVFVGTTLTFAVDSHTKVVPRGNSPIGNGDSGIVEVSVSKVTTAIDLEAGTAWEIIDQLKAFPGHLVPAVHLPKTGAGSESPR